MRLDGREFAEYLQERHQRLVRGMNPKPQLAIVVTGDAAASAAYIKAKQTYGDEIGVSVRVVPTDMAEIMSRIDSLNSDSAVTGVIVQLPLADTSRTDEVLSLINAQKDVDGLTPDSPFEAATPKAIMWLLAAYNIELKAKKIVVVGQGRLVGRPLADRLEESKLEVIRVDEYTSDLKAKLSSADIVVSATGQPALIEANWVKPGTVLIDAGSARVDGKLAGDLDPELYDNKNYKVTPNPGGVGPVTVAALFDNLLIAAAVEV